MLSILWNCSRVGIYLVEYDGVFIMLNNFWFFFFFLPLSTFEINQWLRLNLMMMIRRWESQLWFNEGRWWCWKITLETIWAPAHPTVSNRFHADIAVVEQPSDSSSSSISNSEIIPQLQKSPPSNDFSVFVVEACVRS